MALGSGLDVKLHPDGDMYGFMTHAQAMNMAMWDRFPVETTIEMTKPFAEYSPKLPGMTTRKTACTICIW